MEDLYFSQVYIKPRINCPSCSIYVSEQEIFPLVFSQFEWKDLLKPIEAIASYGILLNCDVSM